MAEHTCWETTLSIDLDALVKNWRFIARQVSPAKAAAVVKADAYGLGAAEVARALAAAGCRHFFVAHVEEASALAPVLPPEACLYVLNGLRPGAEEACLDANAVPVVNTLDQLDRWADTAALLKRSLPAVLQVDTGMSRLGLAPAEVDQILAQPERLHGIALRFIISHLACADEPANPANSAQFTAFQRLASAFPDVPRALDNSAGALLPRRTHFDLVRSGIALYGAAPHKDAANPMRPVVQLRAPILQLRWIAAGTGVGYGLTFRAKWPTRIATVPVGYADGWPCHLGNRGSAFIAGRRVPIAGRISMDSLTLDVTDIPDEHLYPGAPVELLGPHQSVDDVARDAGTISYEILTRLGKRYRRTYLPVEETMSQGSNAA